MLIMSVRELAKYGKPRNIFRGKGLALFQDGSEDKAPFTLVQLTNSSLLFSLDIRVPQIRFLSDLPELSALRGILTDGREVDVVVSFVKSMRTIRNGDAERIVGYAKTWHIGNPIFEEASHVTFDIVNFCFYGTESAPHGNGWKLSKMTLDLEQYIATLHQIPDYDQTVTNLKAQRTIEVTCTASLPIKSSEELEAVTSTIDRLCEVMSVARGTLIAWTSFTVHSQADIPIYSRFRHSVVNRYVSPELVSNNIPKHTKDFLERGYRKCLKLETNFEIRKLAMTYVETKSGLFIESRALLTAVLTEYLASTLARVNNRRPFNWKLDMLSKSLIINFEPGEIDRFVKTRNKLAHEGMFPKDATPSEHYRRMQHFLDRIMLRLFDYQGPYYDIEHGEIREI